MNYKRLQKTHKNENLYFSNAASNKSHTRLIRALLRSASGAASHRGSAGKLG
jgi:hypothetical protein